MADPRTSGAITRLARRAEVAHAEPGIAARTIAGKKHVRLLACLETGPVPAYSDALERRSGKTCTRSLSAEAWLQHQHHQLLLHSRQHTYTHTMARCSLADQSERDQRRNSTRSKTTTSCSSPARR